MDCVPSTVLETSSSLRESDRNVGAIANSTGTEFPSMQDSLGAVCACIYRCMYVCVCACISG